MIGGHGLARGALATLQDQLPDAIAALNAEPGAPVQLVVPSSYALHGRAWPMPALTLEGVMVKVSSPDQDLDDLDTATLQADGRGRVQVTVWVVRTPSGDEDQDHTDLVESLHRYAAGVVACLAHDGTCCPQSVIRKASTAVRAADVDPQAPQPESIMGAVACVFLVDYVEPLAL